MLRNSLTSPPAPNPYGNSKGANPLHTETREARVARDQKAVQKRVNGKRRRAPGSGQPSGFSKPGPVSD